ncbi:hypothetical protein SARC_13153 [Sphaeroforma arctica JP610]|uniref:RRM domain-containing protein n=1 Tax=Sphaeroforma arctica JP610 TaxID=667725 RepID=A0A0L0FC01_9EUKA|nr:hypothetical protein SARC_13153 [Sphaeroforma arctica JP610]KNC74297.1 hypothetical protein SARC_13153 [Sphaeroforma arctica JP610]|eukprot:XP_014148199.1 hypothetical protein SARC_13153 [Sphaeroforma arctica JP610]
MGYVFIAFRSAADRDAAIEFFDGREICEGFIGKAKKAVYRKSKGKANKKEPTRKDDGEKIESTNTEVNTWYGLPQMSLWGAWEGVSRWWWGDWKGENGTSRSLQTGGNGNGNGTNICRNGAGCGLMKGNTEPNTCECEQDRAQHENLRKQHREKGRRDAQDALTDSISDQDDENKFGTRSGSTDANAKGVSGSGNSTTDILGSDPPLLSQLRPLDDLQLIERIRVLGLGAPERYATTRMLMEQLAEYYTEHPRTEVHVQGKSVPAHLLQGCLTSLDSMAWPPKRERRKVKADHYVVINMTKHYKDEYTPRVREACKALMDEMAPEYAFTHIAVTKNFVGSPHKDVLDTSFQFAISLGSFTDGGQLCVENTAGKCEGGTELFVVDTHNKLAKCDGRFIHWVRSYGGGDRYSLIFFTNSVQMSTPKTCAVFPNES